MRNSLPRNYISRVTLHFAMPNERLIMHDFFDKRKTQNCASSRKRVQREEGQGEKEEGSKTPSGLFFGRLENTSWEKSESDEPRSNAIATLAK